MQPKQLFNTLRTVGIITALSITVVTSWAISKSTTPLALTTPQPTPEGESIANFPIPVTGSNLPDVYLPFVGNDKLAILPPNQQIASNDPVLVGAGDIARCNVSGDEATAALVKNISGTVIAIGDTAYDSGTSTQFTNCYNPSWGAFKSRTRPAVGNHEYNTSGASGYFNYFGTAAGPSGKGYYSYNIGAWHVIVLNSECSKVPGGCNPGSAQETWLKQDLAANPTQCTLAYFHEPLFSSGEHGNNSAMKTFWTDLYNAGVELVLNGHDHDYERFAPMNPSGAVDDAKGIREIVVGTGGGNLRPFSTIRANSLKRISNVYGVIKLNLRTSSYDWTFIPQAGKTATDSGTATCH